MTIAARQLSEDEQARLDACSLEPIRTPGAIQPHGVLLVANAASLHIVHVSDNTAALMGLDTDEVLARTLPDVLGAEAFERIAQILDPDVPAASPALVSVRGRLFDAIVHTDDGPILLDLEPVSSPAADDPGMTGTLYAAIHTLARIRTTEQLWSETASVVRSITGFDQVMVYHFHDDDHGEVVGEDVADGMQPYLGLHFPSSDIPTQARDLYLSKLSRVIATTLDEPAALLSAVGAPEAVGLLDLSASELRSVSPQHLRFMRNMGQVSTMSFSLIHDGRLIGMITCAHRSPRRLRYLVRQGLEVLANQVALQLTSIRSIDALSGRLALNDIRSSIVAGLTDEVDIAGVLLDGEVTIGDLVPADGVALRLGGVTASRGKVPPADQLAALMHELAIGADGRGFAADSLSVDYPDVARLVPGACGMLVVPIGGDGDYLAWFRDERVHSIPWLGDQRASNRLTPLSPRNSFASWIQRVTGRCESWDAFQTVAAELGLDIESILLRRVESRLADVALHDPLTGLPNRRLLMDRLDRALERHARGEELALLFLDLDGLKGINDTGGHDAGDAVLVRTARRLEAAARAEDTVSRIGGDEFVILCEDITSEQAEAVAERILQFLRDTEEPGTASIGIATAAPGLSASDLLTRADAAMYRAKAGGRDRVSR
jgi:two-component system, chemotaxis family, sensor kinase Cph1